MKTKPLFLVALHLLLAGGLFCTSAFYFYAENKVDHQPFPEEELKERLTENLEEECFWGRSNTMGTPSLFSEEGRLSARALFATCDAFMARYFVARFSVQTIPLRI